MKDTITKFMTRLGACLPHKAHCLAGHHAWGASEGVTQTQELQRCSRCPRQRVRSVWSATWTMVAKGSEVPPPKIVACGTATGRERLAEN